MARKTDLEKRLDEVAELHAKGVINDDEYALRRAAIMSSPASQIVVKKGGFPIFRVGCLGVIVIGVVVIIAAAAASGGGDDKPASGSAASGSPQVGTNKGDVHVAFGPNATGVIAPEGNDNKKARVTVLQSIDAAPSKNQFLQPPAGKKWWGMEVVVENVGTAEINSLDWKLRDSKDMEHDLAFLVDAGQPLNALFNLTPGGKTQGWVYFEIDKDATPKWIRADPNPFLKNDLYFDIK